MPTRVGVRWQLRHLLCCWLSGTNQVVFDPRMGSPRFARSRGDVDPVRIPQLAPGCRESWISSQHLTGGGGAEGGGCAPVACWARREPCHADTALALPRPTGIAIPSPCRKPRPPPPTRAESRLATTGPGSPSRWASLGAGDLRGRRHPSLQPSRPLATALFRRRRATSVAWRCTSPAPGHVTSLGRACLSCEVPVAHAGPLNLFFT